MSEKFVRRQTREVKVGAVGIGGDNPIRVQSMITEETGNTQGAVRQIIELHKAGAEIVRLTTPTMRDAKNLEEIQRELKRQYEPVPLVADVHHQGKLIAIEAAKHVDKVRINPGLFVFHKKTGRPDEYSQNEIDQQREEIDRALRPVIEACKKEDKRTSMRIGVNHGSLAERLTVMYGNTPKGMVESAMEYIEICEANDFQDLVISMKASRVRDMVSANLLLAETMMERGMDYPIHLGVTEAGNGQSARIKSTAGLSPLLLDGIGDTIRVSLAEDPVAELSVCYDILQACGHRKTKAEIIGCPGCGRTKFNLPTVVDEVREVTGHLKGLDIAVMGCVVNGPGENTDADYGYIGQGGGKIAVMRAGELVKIVPQEKALNVLTDIIKEDGKWVDPPEDKQLRKFIPITPV